MGNESSRSASSSAEVTTAGSTDASARQNRNSADKDAMSPGMFIHQKAGAFSDRYTGVKVLGKGSFGEVVLCKDKVTAHECAVKVISKQSLKQGANASSLLREVELLKELDHPNIMKLYEFFEDVGYYYLVGELYTGGELFDKIARQKKLDILDSARTMKQILSGINYMHNNSIVHRDLKPENLLLENDSSDALIKIIDFGLSTHFVRHSGRKMRDKIGTAYYIAPEVLAGCYNEKVDVWSAGVILYILVTGRPPFAALTEAEILEKVKTGTYSTKYILESTKNQKAAHCVEDLIRHMLMFMPAMRYTAQQCMDHEFISRWSAPPSVDAPKQLPLLESAINNMRLFQSSQKLAKAALLYMGSKLTTKEETKDLTLIFEKLDKNGDGQLDRNELKTGYKELMKLKGIDVSKLDEEAVENEVDIVLQSIDFDHNGFLNYSEFVTVCMDRKQLMTKQRLQRAFDMFDVDGSGKISSEELQSVFVMSGLQKAESDAIIKSVDENDDGEIDLEEFEEMLRALIQVKEVASIVQDEQDASSVIRG